MKLAALEESSLQVGEGCEHHSSEVLQVFLREKLLPLIYPEAIRQAHQVRVTEYICGTLVIPSLMEYADVHYIRGRLIGQDESGGNDRDLFYFRFFGKLL
jgi:hypothetical protein